MSGDESLRIDAEHPWPWLDAFPESAQAFFNGREAATAQLLRCVLAAPATVLFGKSGLGKTSLLQAGLFPLLRAPERRLLPVLVRLDHGVDRPGLSAQLLARLRAETQAHQIAWEHPALPDGDTLGDTARLWELLHDSRTQWRDAEGRRWTPVFVLDQFEEVFTLVAEVAAQQRLFDELGNLVQGRIPAEVAARLDAHDELLDRIDPERLGARFVLSLREDYLPDLEIHADRIPRLGPNRYRLLPMSQAEALEAIDKTGGALVDAADAERIVRFLDQQNLSVDPNRPHPQRRERIEPALLSLVCAGLNQHRVEQRAPKLDARSLDRLGGQLLEKFYDDALAALPEKRREVAARFIETELITLDGTRRPFPEQSLARVGLDGEDIARLKDRRLLRTENTEHGAYVELVHDRIATVVAGRAQKSREREAARKEREKRALWWRIVAGIVGVLCAGLIWTWLQWQKVDQLSTQLNGTNRTLEGKLAELKVARDQAASAEANAKEKAGLAEQRASEAKAEAERALKAERQAKAAQADAETQKGKALAAARDATAQRVLSDANDFFGGINRPATGIQSLLMTLAGHRLTQKSAVPFVQNAGYAALQREFNRSGALNWVRESNASITCMAISPDGSRIVSGNGDNTLRLWDARSGRSMGEPIKGHSSVVYSVAFSPDGSRIASGSGDKTLRLWDAHSGSPLSEPLKGHSDFVTSVAFSPDGSRIVSGSQDGTLRLWDVYSGDPIGEPLKGHSKSVTSVAFSPDGSRIVSGSKDSLLRLWDARSGKSIGNPLDAHLSSITSVAFSPNSSRIVSGSADKTLRLWDARSGKPIGKPLDGHSDIVTHISFSPGGTYILSGSYDRTLRLWDSHSGNSISSIFQGHSDYISGVAFSANGLYIISSGKDKTIRKWDMRHGESIEDNQLQNESVRPSDGLKIINEVPSNTIRQMIRLTNDNEELLGSILQQIPINNNSDFSFSKLLIVSNGDSSTLRLWDGRSGKPIGEPLTGHSKSVSSVAFSPDGTRIVSGSWDNTLRLWDTHSGNPIGESLKGHSKSVISVAFSPDGTRIVSGSWDNTLRLWDVRSGKPIGEPLIDIEHKDIVGVAFSPDGSRIVSGGRDTVRLWDAHSGNPIGKLIDAHLGSSASIAFSPDGSLIVSGSRKYNTLRLWDARSGNPIGESLKGHSKSVTSVAFSPDGSRIVSGSWDKTLRLWDARSGTPIGEPLSGYSWAKSKVIFSPDGTRIVSSSHDHTLVQWPVLEGWATELCAKLPRNMTRKEWREWISPDIDYVVQCPGLPVPAD